MDAHAEMRQASSGSESGRSAAILRRLELTQGRFAAITQVTAMCSSTPEWWFMRPLIVGSGLETPRVYVEFTRQEPKRR